jgi:translation elongation factor EF-1alpha
MPEQKVGVVTHYFGHIRVAAVTLEDELQVGDQIRVLGHTSDFSQQVDSMQLEHKEIEAGKKGDEIAIKVADHAREHDEVFKVTE